MRFTFPLAAVAALTAVAAPAHAQEARDGDWIVRLRAILVAPNERSGAVEPGFPGSRLGVDNSVMPEIDFTYMATKHVGAELILATTRHDVSGRGTLSALGKVADTWVLPPTLTLQYHFLPDAHVRPYVGAGVNYTIFYASHASDALNNAVGDTRLKLSNSFGYALQAGVDTDITDRVFLNLDIKYIDIDTDARLDTGGAINRARVHIDPIVAGVGVGMRF